VSAREISAASVASAQAVAAALRDAGVRAETIEGYGAVPKAHVWCDDAGGRFTIEAAGATQDCTGLADLIRSIEALS
jgi:hypothetical protein